MLASAGQIQKPAKVPSTALNRYPRRFVSSAVMRLLVATMEYSPVEAVRSSLKGQWKVLYNTIVPNYFTQTFLDSASNVSLTY
ncbi:hypothetical protein ASZ78_013263 [Callipepla squamata]|uniref:Uncharacterized protein n=1 Tax=Callipepla squamata TaxID=9009 RepID=A0A226MHZ6_CALSU|nr:hypothetical protein ASZ78_013263 [Callipepla squamata]